MKIDLSPETEQKLKELAECSGRSVSALANDAIALYVDDPEKTLDSPLPWGTHEPYGFKALCHLHHKREDLKDRYTTRCARR